MQPATGLAVPTKPSVTLSKQIQKSPGYCVTCTPARKQCHTEYPMLLKSDWSDSEEKGKDNNDQNKVEEEIEDWDDDL